MTRLSARTVRSPPPIRGIAGADRGNFLEDSGAILQIPEFGRGHADVLFVRAAEIVKDTNELLGLREGQRAEENSVNHAEGGDVCADA